MPDLFAIEAQTRVASPDFTVGGVECRPTYKPEAVFRIEQSIKFMAQHLNRPMQVNTLAARANISSSHFFTLFKRQIGRSPMEYFTRLRMQCACGLLKNTPMSIKEIASETGYRDPLYFSRVFKSVNRIAPSGYRAAHRETAGKVGNGRKNLKYSRKPSMAGT